MERTKLLEQRERLEKRGQLCQQKLQSYERQEDTLNKKNLYLQEQSAKKADDAKKFELIMEIQQAQKELENIENNIRATEQQKEDIDQKIENIDQEINKSDICRIFNCLIDLDRDDHVKCFSEFVRHYKAGAFFIHGFAKYSLRFLLKRILMEFPYKSTEYIPIRLSSDSQSYNWESSSVMEITDHADIADYLWKQVGRKLRLTGEPSSFELSDVLFKKLKTQNIILTIDALDSRYKLDDIIEKFWLELADNIQKTSNYFLMIVLIEDSDCFKKCRVDCVETYDVTWRYRIPVKLPIVGKFAKDDLESWIKSKARGIFDLSIKDRASQIVEEILKSSDNGSADSVIEYICTELCQCEFDEGALIEWLNL